ncbi:hypothetical protein SAMN05421548_101242 [Paraburkholderia lycopersici]|uniref:Uncharacterized protein n=1 Tax=Paraburkholderia lycopersici TaxID=416944 RepID=A0A1G6GRH0_9BURK|nr:hypothetical protein SAMN05421548_101242 [Paraburkholderia lycopersici]
MLQPAHCAATRRPPQHVQPALAVPAPDRLPKQGLRAV